MLPQLTKEGLGFRDLSDEDMDGSVLFFIQPDQTGWGGVAIMDGAKSKALCGGQRPHAAEETPL